LPAALSGNFRQRGWDRSNVRELGALVLRH
jgi:hypothetical protein